MTDIQLLEKLGPQLLEVIKNNYLENEHQYDKFINFITSLLPLIEPKNVSISDICSVFKSNLLNPIVENGLDEEGNELEDVLTIPKSGEPLIKSIKTKGWVTNEIELKILNSTYFKLVKKNSGLESFVNKLIFLSDLLLFISSIVNPLFILKLFYNSLPI